jgi:polyisoprenoid-binding protein YceI
MRRLLDTGHSPEAVFVATRFDPDGDGGVIEGEFTLHGTARPLSLQVTQTGPGAYQATGSVVQSSYGIKPYSGFFGALKVRDAVVIEAEAKLPTPGDA